VDTAHCTCLGTGRAAWPATACGYHDAGRAGAGRQAGRGAQKSRGGALRCLVRCGSAAAQVPPAEPKLRALAALAGSDLRFGAAGAWAA